jgi:beta-lactamase class D
MTTLNDECKASRVRYVNGEITHQEHYLWLAGKLGIKPNMLPFTPDRIIESNDPNFNDTPLLAWDRRDEFIRLLAGTQGIKAWSKSDTVCVLKAVARKVRDDARGGKV